MKRTGRCDHSRTRIRQLRAAAGRTRGFLASTYAALLVTAGAALAQQPVGDEPVAEVTDDAADALGDAANAAIERVKEVDYSKVTLDEIVVWLLIGLLVGGIAGRLLTRRKGGLGPAGNLLLGCAGAVVGGFLVDFFGIDVGFGQISMSYEEIFAALFVAIGIVAGIRALQRRLADKKLEKQNDKLADAVAEKTKQS